MRLLKILLLFGLLQLSFNSNANEPTALQIESVRKIVAQFFKEKRPPGLSVAIGKNRKVIWAEGFGLADLEQNVPVTTNTKFRFGSVAKPLTAYALAKLVESGKVDLDKSFYNYVPDFPQKKYDFTVRQLAGHVAGIRHYKKGEPYLRTHYNSIRTGFSIFEDSPLLHPPGEKFRYSSYGYNLLAAVIEEVSQQSYLLHMESKIFSPIGMNNTVADNLDIIISNRGRYYFKRDNFLLNEPEVDNSYKWSSGGLLSTPTDIVNFGMTVLNEQQISKQIQEEFWKPIKTLDGSETEYALGWRVIDGEYGLWIGHGGGSIGGTSQFWIWPEHDIVISMACNLTDFDYEDVLLRIKKVFDTKT